MQPSLATTDTIAAIATPAGRGGVGIVRISGPAVRRIANAVCDRVIVAGKINLRKFLQHDKEVIDEGIALLFRAPRSYTGEDILELHGHGGRVVIGLLLDRVIELGARNARPGEFTERAYLNDKMDLAQAEAVADLINSRTVAAAKSAQSSLQGNFSARVNVLLDSLIEARVWTEAAIDFPEEEIDFLKDDELKTRLSTLEQRVEETLTEAKQGALLNEGLTMVISGAPNVGKSSLLNRLAGYDRAIVTDVPGTTRDLLHEDIEIHGVPLRVVDTAGLRETADRVEFAGIDRARKAIAAADLLLVMVDDTDAEVQRATQGLFSDLTSPIITVCNKVDLSNGPFGKRTSAQDEVKVGVSALTGEGFEVLVEEIAKCAGLSTGGESTFLARRRHVHALQRCLVSIVEARALLNLSGAGELVAEELRQGQQALGEVTGAFDNEQLLDEIFSGFCVGK